MKYYAISELAGDTRADDAIIAFYGDETRFWGDFKNDLSILRTYVAASSQTRWLLNCDDAYLFACALVATLQCGREAILSANTTPECVAEIVGGGQAREGQSGRAGFLSDRDLPGAVSLHEVLVSTVPGDPDFPAIDPDKARVTLYTSGSTGRPKAFPKRLTELEAETGELWLLWKDDLEGRRVYSTVNHHHIYGLLFSILLPLQAGLPVCVSQISYPESLSSIADPAPVLVCSPAFYKRVAETGFPSRVFRADAVLFSSGGVLPARVARAVEERLGAAPREIYGSTETGGIAWRWAVREESWLPFARNEIAIAEDGRIRVRSPYIVDPEGFTCGDLGRYLDDGRFVLEGRADSIVKIEEKRISLAEVESRLLESPYAKEACVIALTGRRQYLGAAVVLSPDGLERFKDATKLEMNDYFRGHLGSYLENTVIPKKWRFVSAIPRNTEDKILRSDVEALFRKGEDLTVHSTDKDGPSLRIELTVGHESCFFDGHFPTFALLPGVAQCDLAMRFAHEKLEVPLAIRTISRMKFKRPIKPDVRIALILTFDRGTGRLTFSYRDAVSDSLYSEAVVTLGEQ